MWYSQIRSGEKTPYERKVGQMIFQGPFQPGLFYESMKSKVIQNYSYPLLQIDDILTL